jgi:F-type H+-transporting ATPase subunit epsilon
MAKTFQVGIYSADKVIYEGQALSLVVPSVSGYLGVLADHAPLVAKLSSGKIIIRSRKGELHYIDSTESGFLQVLQNQVSLLL